MLKFYFYTRQYNSTFRVFEQVKLQRTLQMYDRKKMAISKKY